ncbi:MAG: CPBP family intramembrane metalloprotease [Myxococcales bacterium]|nr:CPBP family intramembrane metalloprotease [Myxococcales bacterium]MCB9581844.1 CPBP family intramembrane metalloprotease [Polyangiaceae bacterium]
MHAIVLAMFRWGRFAAAYAILGAASSLIAVVWRSGSPLVHPDPWLMLGDPGRHIYSAMLGAALGGLIVMSTRLFVTRFSWARRLHAELRPLARGMSLSGIIALAALSAVGEELLFRGLLAPWLGLVPQALLFGLVHQIRGPSRWVWVAWATLVGLLLGGVFQLSGSLAGPLVAHALVNGLNLHYLKAHDPEPPRRSLGGLLGQRS